MSLLNGSNGTTSWWDRRRAKARKGPDLTPFRALALQLHHDHPAGEGSRSSLLVTPSMVEFATATCLTLGVCLAEQLGGPVLLVDSAPGAGSLSELVGCEDSIGLAEVLSGSVGSFAAAALPLAAPGLLLLPHGYAPFSAAAAVPALESALMAASAVYDFILLFGGALAANPLNLALAPLAGTTLLTVVENRTSVDDLRAAQNSLRLARARRVEVVMTSVVSGVQELPAGAALRTPA